MKSLPFKISEEDLYELFGKFGAIRQIRLGSTAETRGRAFVVYEDIFDAKNALEKLTGFNVLGRYLVVLYYNAGSGEGDKNKLAGSHTGKLSAQQQRADLQKKKQELENLKNKFGVKGEE